ncbi:hypothetical protein LTR40_010946, partial [Exophiala xenobiotica]
ASDHTSLRQRSPEGIVVSIPSDAYPGCCQLHLRSHRGRDIGVLCPLPEDGQYVGANRTGLRPRCRMHQPVGSNSRHLPTQSLPGFRAVQPTCPSGRLESLVCSVRCIVLEIGRNGPFTFMYRQDMADLHGRHGLPIVQGHVFVFGDQFSSSCRLDHFGLCGLTGGCGRWYLSPIGG